MRELGLSLHGDTQAWQASDRVDPYLRVAMAMAFADHDVALSGLALTFELVPGLSVHDLADVLQTPDRVRSHWQGEHAVFGTAWLSLTSAQRWGLQGPPACIARFEMGMPWRDLRGDVVTPSSRPAPPLPARTHRARSTADTLWVVMDHGCPFAHPALRRGDGQTKVLHLWDQAPTPELGETAHLPWPWGYGAELNRGSVRRRSPRAKADVPSRPTQGLALGPTDAKPSSGHRHGVTLDGQKDSHGPSPPTGYLLCCAPCVLACEGEGLAAVAAPWCPLAGHATACPLRNVRYMLAVPANTNAAPMGG